MLRSPMRTLVVGLGERSYRIRVGEGLSSRLAALLRPFAGRRIAAVSSPRVWALHGKRVEASLRALGPLSRVLVPEGERAKSLRTLGSLHDAFLRAGIERGSLVVAFGGGVVGDVAGFAAATYMRGVDWVQLPTTLLAMVDSSVGGKTGINHRRAKNLVGAFHQPRAVVTDTAFLQTLPERELRSGAYEILKCGILGDPALFRLVADAPGDVAAWEPERTERAIVAACRLKARVVERDEREGGLRRVLNLGHTIGHAIEATTRYRRFTHGEAVGWGLLGATWIALRRRLLDEDAGEAIAAAVDRLGPRPAVSDLDPRRVVEAIARDKKAQEGRVPFVLPTAIGRVEIAADVAQAEVREALASLGMRGRPARRNPASRRRRA
jgi:3-dehydroquinate synthase